MKNRSDGIPAALFGVLLIVAALLDPWITVGLCVAITLALGIYHVRRFVRVMSKIEERRREMKRRMQPDK